MTKANERQIGGDHYKGAKFQHWDLISRNGIGYLEGCATKYPSRWRRKNGIEDVEKGIHYIDKILESVEDFSYSASGFADEEDLTRFFTENNITDENEVSAISLICQWKSTHHLELARLNLEKLLQKAKQIDLMPQ